MKVEQGILVDDGSSSITYYKIGKIVIVCSRQVYVSMTQWQSVDICTLPYKPINDLSIPVVVAQNKTSTMVNCIRLINDETKLKANSWGSMYYDNASISFTFAYICE